MPPFEYVVSSEEDWLAKHTNVYNIIMSRLCKIYIYLPINTKKCKKRRENE